MDKIATEKALAILKQALSDKIAQQDYIRIPIEQFSSITSEEKTAIKKHIANWPNILLITPYEKEARIIALNPPYIIFYDTMNSKIIEVNLDE